MPAMDLLTFISDRDRKTALAAALEASEGYLWQIATGWRGKRASWELAQRIEAATSEIGPEAVPKHSLRPDIWPAAEQDGGAQSGRAKRVAGAAR